MVLIFFKLLIILMKVVTAVFALLAICLVILRYKAENRLPYGTGISTWSKSERTEKNIPYQLTIMLRKHNAIWNIRKHFRITGEHINIKQAETRLKNITKELLNDIVKQYPATQEYVTNMPEIFIQSDYRRYKKAAKDFNASSYDVGTTGLNVAYILKYITVTDESEKKMWISLIAQVLFHEASHHQFKLKAGQHLIKKHSEQLMHHINEYYADLRAFDIMNLDINSAAKIMEMKAALITDKKQFTTFLTHPSSYCREKFVVRGSFNVYSILWAADMINLSKGKEYLKDKEIKLITDKIGEFERKHPEITVEFELL